MANTIYTTGLERIGQAALDLDAAGTDIRIMLKKQGTTYTISKDHEFVSQVIAAGFTEITSAGYARQTVASKTFLRDLANFRSEWDHNDVSFGSLPTGEVCNGYLVYQHIGADSVNPVIFYVDTAAGLPLTFNGTEVKIMVNAEGHLWFLQP